MAVRLQDIANDLNLSAMTISKVLRGQTDVSAETTKRVLKRVKELNYRPNVSARSLRTGQTYSVGLTTASLSDAFVPGLVRGLNEVLRAARYGLIVSCSDYSEDSAEAQEREAELHLARQVDALLVHLREDASDFPRAFESVTVPLILIGNTAGRPATSGVYVADIEVGYRAARFLLGRKARRIAYLRGPRTPTADLRFSGFLQAMRESNMPVHQHWIAEVKPGPEGYQRAFSTTQRILEGRPRPDAILAYSDFSAAAARDAALQSGFSIPGQMQILGCGNHVPLCEIGLRISSVDLAPLETGRRAARLALKAIENKNSGPHRTVTVEPYIVERDSTRRS